MHAHILEHTLLVLKRIYLHLYAFIKTRQKPDMRNEHGRRRQDAQPHSLKHTRAREMCAMNMHAGAEAHLLKHKLARQTSALERV